MANNKEKDFVASPPPYVVIPYSEYEKVVNMAQEMEEMRKLCKRQDERYAAIMGMFAECLEEIRKIREYVSD